MVRQSPETGEGQPILSHYREALQIIYKTKPVASHPIAVHPRVPVDFRNAIKSAFLKLGQTTEGSNLLAKIPIKNIGEASMADYHILKKMELNVFM
ncbi:MAG: PhnD/SsuA/transferrin family substrate-binding protein [Gammaproteobacteria bacterium]|nr:PhnD/SsuA/transferrin family substrate-binding protein [Gammaproteobacteria bacterium]